MKICIYNEPCRGGLGGSEISVALLAAALAKEHTVRLLHYRPEMTADVLQGFAETDLRPVTVQLGPRMDTHQGPIWNACRRYRAEKRQEAGLSRDCDVFIAFVHEPPPFCAAPFGVLCVLFPFHDLSGSGWLKDSWYRLKLRKRLATYQKIVANSEYTQRWTYKRWNVRSDIAYPPVSVEELSQPREKANLILSVGRFSQVGHSKRQREMIAAFGRLRAGADYPWDYILTGSCGSAAADRSLLTTFEEAAADSGASIEPNVSRARLRELYGRATIFWHASGYGVDEEKTPELAEHFGIATVEAMAAGCVPVVIDRGGQREIVEHGVSGFLWSTLDELRKYTVQLMEDASLRMRMSAAARERAQRFSRERFVESFRVIISQLISDKLNGRTAVKERKTAGIL